LQLTVIVLALAATLNSNPPTNNINIFFMFAVSFSDLYFHFRCHRLNTLRSAPGASYTLAVQP
jgi:hypothetical protein